jgi:cytohesin
MVANYSHTFEKHTQYLLNEGRDINYRFTNFGDGNTPLHDAVKQTHNPSTQMLLSGNPSPTFDLVSVLIKYGADVTIKNNNGDIPLHLASQVSNDENVFNKLLESQKSITINARNKNDQTPLHLACDAGEFKNALILIQNGATVNVIDNKKKIPLHYLMTNTVFISIGESDFKDLVLHLLKGNEEYVNFQDNDGNTPLHSSTILKTHDKSKYKTKMISFLITNGADVNIKNNAGQTPSEMAGDDKTLVTAFTGGHSSQLSTGGKKSCYTLKRHTRRRRKSKRKTTKTKNKRRRRCYHKTTTEKIKNK